MPNKRIHAVRLAVPHRPGSKQRGTTPAQDASASDATNGVLRTDSPSLAVIDRLTGKPLRQKTFHKPAELLIEGGRGSLLTDLRRLGVELHREAFAFRMPDDSLIHQDIRSGDIAIVEPCTRELAEGDIMMVPLDGVATLRCVTYRGNIAYFQGRLDQEPSLIPVWGHVFSGVVIATFRMFYHGRILLRPNAMACVTTITKSRERQCVRRTQTLAPTAYQLPAR